MSSHSPFNNQQYDNKSIRDIERNNYNDGLAFNDVRPVFNYKNDWTFSFLKISAKIKTIFDISK